MRQTTAASLQLTNSSLAECGPHRVASCSVSWSCHGQYLAMAGSDRSARILAVDAANSATREVLTVSGHNASVTKVRFHPVDKDHLCTAAADKMIRLWDIRNAQQKDLGHIELQSGCMAVEWSKASSSLLVVTERDGGIHVYDSRKLGSSLSSSSRATSNTTPALYSFRTKPAVADVCIFTPDGEYLIAGTSIYGMSDTLRIWSWKEASQQCAPCIELPTHGPIYAMQFSPDDRYLATGGSDATVGIWQVDTMTCGYAVSRPTKYVRGVAFSHDSKILATCTEEDAIDLADPVNGACIGQLNLSPPQRRGGGGAEEVAWHPDTSHYLLACARTDSQGMPPNPIVLARLSIQ